MRETFGGGEGQENRKAILLSCTKVVGHNSILIFYFWRQGAAQGVGSVERRGEVGDVGRR